MEVKPLSQGLLCDDPYIFSYSEVTTVAAINAGGAWSLFCFDGDGMVTDGREHRPVESGQVVHGSGPGSFIGTGKVFLVANRQATQAIEFLDLTTEPKLVTKPWGKELWLTGERGDYCLKCIHINAGHQTSLQYHREKVETNVIMSGTAQVIGEDFDETVEGPVYVHITPPTVHRIRAITDIVLVEASTAHLDDVVRLQDDSGRGDGRIDTEHQ